MFFRFAEKKYQGNFRDKTTSNETSVDHYINKISWYTYSFERSLNDDKIFFF